MTWGDWIGVIVFAPGILVLVWLVIYTVLDDDPFYEFDTKPRGRR